MRLAIWSARLTRCLALLALTGSWTAIAAPSASAATYGSSVVQVGVWSSDVTDRNATGVQGYLGHYPLPQTTVDGDPMYV